MYSTDADGARRRVLKRHKKVGWPSEQDSYCCKAAEVMLSRPRSSTPTMHDKIMRDCHRMRVAEESGRPGNVGGGRGSPYQQTTGSTAKRQQGEHGRNQRSQSSDHHRPVSQVYLD